MISTLNMFDIPSPQAKYKLTNWEPTVSLLCITDIKNGKIRSLLSNTSGKTKMIARWYLKDG